MKWNRDLMFKRKTWYLILKKGETAKNSLISKYIFFLQQLIQFIFINKPKLNQNSIKIA